MQTTTEAKEVTEETKDAVEAEGINTAPADQKEPETGNYPLNRFVWFPRS